LNRIDPQATPKKKWVEKRIRLRRKEEGKKRTTQEKDEKKIY
jgi:hypothetical protein